MNAPVDYLQGVDLALLPRRDEEYILRDVFEKHVHGSRGDIVFDLGDCFLQFGVDCDTDQILPEFHSGAFRKRKSYRGVQGADGKEEAKDMTYSSAVRRLSRDDWNSSADDLPSTWRLIP